MNEQRDRRLTTSDLADAGREEQRQAVEYAGAQSPGAGMAREESTLLFSPSEAESMRARWSDIQAGFVDEPRKAVEHADSLVADCIRRLAESFAEERKKLEQQWDRGGDVSTEDLRVALQRYRSFFTRLLSV
ncbi:MAG TPA: hypothetical protein VN442_05315 [Bryobacteraceae bacterium]|nr:hypothetical protein [Bryobacteraceae bacterium]